MRISQAPEIADAFERQAEACVGLGATFTARLCRLFGARLDDSSTFGRHVLAWPRDSLLPDLMPLRCCAALNLLVRRGQARRLEHLYPPYHAPDDDELWSAVVETIGVHDVAATAFLESPPQTNEVSRSAILLGGFLTIAAATGKPLALAELGASAGLNLLFDRYSFDLGEGRRWGPNSPVRIACAWTGAAPALDARLEVVSRAAVDLRPVDARSQADRDRMLAYIWPEQTERLRRIEPALDIVADSDIVVEQGDALAWLRRRMAGPAPGGVCRVVYHSVFLQYLPPALRDSLRAEIRGCGEAATADAPFAWLAMESAPDRKACELRLTLWPGGEKRALARVDWHGRWAEWA